MISKDKWFGFLDSFNGKEKEMKKGPEHWGKWGLGGGPWDSEGGMMEYVGCMVGKVQKDETGSSKKNSLKEFVIHFKLWGHNTSCETEVWGWLFGFFYLLLWFFSVN